jgi:hypothetical protein
VSIEVRRLVQKFFSASSGVMISGSIELSAVSRDGRSKPGQLQAIGNRIGVSVPGYHISRFESKSARARKRLLFRVPNFFHESISLYFLKNFKESTSRILSVQNFLNRSEEFSDQTCHSNFVIDIESKRTETPRQDFVVPANFL